MSEEDIIHIISAYARQARIDESVKSQFWEEIYEQFQLVDVVWKSLS